MLIVDSIVGSETLFVMSHLQAAVSWCSDTSLFAKPCSDDRHLHEQCLGNDWLDLSESTKCVSLWNCGTCMLPSYESRQMWVSDEGNAAPSQLPSGGHLQRCIIHQLCID